MQTSIFSKVAAIGITSVMLMASHAAIADYRILQRTPDAHIVLTPERCEPFANNRPDPRDKLGYFINGNERTKGCWSEQHGEIRFVFQAYGMVLYYPASHFKYIGTVTYTRRYGNVKP